MIIVLVVLRKITALSAELALYFGLNNSEAGWG